jgi:hypothetical protein
MLVDNLATKTPRYHDHNSPHELVVAHRLPMKSSPRSFVRVQGKYPHQSWIQQGLAIPPTSLLTSPEPLIAPPEPMLPHIEIGLWSTLLSLALMLEKTRLLLKTDRVHGNRKFPDVRRTSHHLRHGV